MVNNLKQNFVRSLVVLPLLSIVINTTPVFAISPVTNATQTVTEAAGRHNPLTTAKQQLCQTHESFIKLRLTRIQTLLDKEITDFDKIAVRVETYYTNTLVPKSKIVPNYTALKTDIETKKTAAQAAVKALSADITSFSCTGEDPKGNLTKFSTDMAAIRSALKDYRTSIKNLIVAVRSIRGVLNSDRLTPKPSAEASTAKTSPTISTNQ